MSDTDELAFRDDLTDWLMGLVGCDCDNGIRYSDPLKPYDSRHSCDCCVLVEVSGIQIRVPSEHLGHSSYTGHGVVLPAVEVADE